MTPPATQLLAGLHVIVTRPPAQAKSWQQRLEAQGARVTLLPVLAIEPLRGEQDQQRIKDKILRLAEYQKVIFVSQNAVSQAWQWIDQFWPQLPAGQQLFAIGSSTAAMLQQCVERHEGVKVKAAQQAMNSEALLELTELQSVAGEKILLCRGLGGRPTLMQQLQQRGARVELCELYRRVLPVSAVSQMAVLWPLLLNPESEPVASNSKQNCVLSVHSGESLENLHSVLEQVARTGSVNQLQLERIKSLPLLVPGQRVAAMAKQLGFTKVIVATNATDVAMVEALVNWRHRIQ